MPWTRKSGLSCSSLFFGSSPRALQADQSHIKELGMDVLERMPGDAEAAAAIAVVGGWQVDDRIVFSLPGDWRAVSARVAYRRECDGWLVVEADGGEGYYSIHPDWARGF